MTAKKTLERIDMEAKMHIHAFCEIVPDQITGRKYAVVRKNCDGQIIHQYTNYYTPEQLKIAVSNYINGMWEAEICINAGAEEGDMYIGI